MTLLTDRPVTTGSAPPVTNRAAARLLLAAAAIGAGFIHLALAEEHVEEYLPLGIGFLVTGVLQVLWGVLISIRESRPLLLAGGVFSLLFLGAYLMSRTVGLPLGPEAFAREGVGRADLLCCALEVPVALGAFLLARRPSALRSPLSRRWAVAAAAGVLLTAATTTSALAAPTHEHHRTCPSAPVLTGDINAQGVDTGVTSYFSCKLLHEHDGEHEPHE